SFGGDVSGVLSNTPAKETWTLVWFAASAKVTDSLRPGRNDDRRLDQRRVQWLLRDKPEERRIGCDTGPPGARDTCGFYGIDRQRAVARDVQPQEVLEVLDLEGGECLIAMAAEDIQGDQQIESHHE